MKKYLLIIFVLTLVTGCSSTPIVDENAPTNNLETKSTPINQRLNTCKNDMPQAVDNTQFEDLASKYSQVIMKTNQGDITIELFGEDSPETVNNFLNLAKLGFYDGIKFHRVIKDFMIQSGDPLSCDPAMLARWGTGGPGYAFADEFNDHKLIRGSLAMANSGPNTNGSQFFIVTTESTPWLDGKHTNFGEVVEGMDIVDKIEAAQTDARDVPMTDMVIESIELVK